MTYYPPSTRADGHHVWIGKEIFKQVASVSLVCTPTYSMRKNKPAWEPLSDGYLKINVGYVWCCFWPCRHQCRYMRLDRRVSLIAWRVVFHVWDAEEVEAMACREGLQLGAKWCRRKCILKSILKSDYLSMARLLQQPFIQRSSLHPIREAT
jgi:hypothetical protein